MIKAIAALISMIAACSYANAELVPVKAEAVGQYVVAVNRALLTSRLSCTDSKGASRFDGVDVIREHISNADFAWVDRSGVQPAVVIVWGGYDGNPQGSTNRSTRVVTSGDYKQIVSVTSTAGRATYVNSGTLVEPVISTAYLEYFRISCVSASN